MQVASHYALGAIVLTALLLLTAETLYALRPGCANTIGAVTPISVSTNTAGKKIVLPGLGPDAFAVTPDATTVYIGAGGFGRGGGEVVPVDTATHTVGKPIVVAGPFADTNALAITPAP